MRVKLNQEVNYNGEITTPADLLDSGRAIVERVDNFGKNSVTKYFVTLLDADGTPTRDCFEIGQKAYESRAAKGQDTPSKFSAASVPRPVYHITIDPAQTRLTVRDAAYAPTDYPIAVMPVRHVQNDGFFWLEVDAETWVKANALAALLTDSGFEVLGIEWGVIAFEAPHVEPDGTSPYMIENQRRAPYGVDYHNLRRVTIPATEAHEGIYSLEVVLYWRCPVCGAPRGEPTLTISWDGSRRLFCSGWVNPCGHIDTYRAAKGEAFVNGLN